MELISLKGPTTAGRRECCRCRRVIGTLDHGIVVPYLTEVWFDEDTTAVARYHRCLDEIDCSEAKEQPNEADHPYR